MLTMCPFSTSSLRLEEIQGVEDVASAIDEDLFLAGPSTHSRTQSFTNQSRRTKPSSSERGVGDLDIFRKNVEALHAEDTGENETWSGDSKKLLFGILVKSKDVEQRDVLRQTWMQQDQICKASSGPTDGCVVYVTFVTTVSEPLPADCIEAQDCLQVRAPEGWTHLYHKTKAMFLKAIDAFPWATHIGKLDVDTFPYFHRLLPEISNSQYSLVGHMYSTSRAPCRSPSDSVLGHTGSNKVLYPQGGFYLLSRDLAAGAFAEHTQNQCDQTVSATIQSKGRMPEDMYTGFLIQEFERRAEVTVKRIERDSQRNFPKWIHPIGSNFQGHVQDA